MAGSTPLDPTELEQTSFELVRRGYDPARVERTITLAAAAIRELQRERDVLERRLADLESVPAEPLEAHRVAEALGVEATHVLEAAHVAAAERAERAEREAEAVRAEALAAAEQIRAEAALARDDRLAEATREAEAIVEDGRLRGRDMVNEAQVVRERMLGDLARKRQTGRAQVEQLRAGRDRLLESLSIAQSSLDTAMKDLVDSVPEARGAAERAGLRVQNEPTPTVETLEAEIEAARLVGHPLVEGIAEPGSPEEAAEPVPDPAFVTAEMEALTHIDEALDAPAADPDAGAAVTDPPFDGAVEDASSEDIDDAESNEAEADAESDEAEAEADDTVDQTDTSGDADEDAHIEAGDEESADVDAPPVADAELDSPAADGPAADEPVDGVDDLFARLRDARVDDDKSDADETDADDAPVDEEPEMASDETDDSGEEEAAPAPEPDPEAIARDRAVSVATRALKKVLVEEQGTLLDGIRRSGGDAVAVVVADADAHAAPYEEAASAAFKDLMEAVGGSGVEADAGYAQLRAVGLDPVRQRLLEVAERSDDRDELSDAVRGLYRESRSRRIPAAAAAAVNAVSGAIVVATAGSTIRWVVDPAGPCGADCADNALAGSISPGDAFPTGAIHPPTDPTCTCRLVVDEA